MSAGTNTMKTCLYWNCLGDYDMSRREQVFDSSPSTNNEKMIWNLADSMHKGVIERRMMLIPETNYSALDIRDTCKILSDWANCWIKG